MEAKQCPDGSYVGRTGPKCEFVACPIVVSSATTGWQTYKNEQYGFEFQYPEKFGVLSVLNDGSLAIGNNGGANVVIYMPKSEDFSMLMKDYDSKGYTKTILQVGGIQSLGVSSSQIGDTVFVPLPGGRVQEIEGSFKLPEFIQLLSTFKFTK